MKDTENNRGKLKTIGIPVAALLVIVMVSLSLTAFAANPATDGTSKTTTTQTSEVKDAEVQNDKETGTEADEAEEINDPAVEASEDTVLVGKAKITDAQASATALAANQGTSVVSTKLGDENGTVVYEVTLKGTDRKTAEVLVDAEKNIIVSNDNDDDNAGEVKEKGENDDNEADENNAAEVEND